MRGDGRHVARHDRHMDDLTEDDLSLDMVDAVVFDALGRIGDDPQARHAFFRRLVDLARQVVRDAADEAKRQAAIERGDYEAVRECEVELSRLRSRYLDLDL